MPFNLCALAPMTDLAQAGAQELVLPARTGDLLSKHPMGLFCFMKILTVMSPLQTGSTCGQHLCFTTQPDFSSP